MTTSNYDRFYDSLDEPCDKTLDPKTPDEYLEFIKLGSHSIVYVCKIMKTRIYEKLKAVYEKRIIPKISE